MLLINRLCSSNFELFSCIECPKVSLNLDGRGFLPKKFLSSDVHFEFRLNLECGEIVPFPLFLTLVGSKIVELPYILKEGLCGVYQFH